MRQQQNQAQIYCIRRVLITPAGGRCKNREKGERRDICSFKS